MTTAPHAALLDAHAPDLGVTITLAVASTGPLAFVEDVLVRLLTSVAVGVVIALFTRYVLPRLDPYLKRRTLAPVSRLPTPTAPRDPPPPPAA